MNCHKCDAQLSIRSPCKIIKSHDNWVKYECLSCPVDIVKQKALQKAYVQFCQALQAACEMGPELSNAILCAHQAVEWAERAV